MSDLATQIDTGASVRGTGSRTTRILGWSILAGLVLVAWLSFVATRGDTEMGETVRLLYVHVPAAMTAYIACTLATVGSGVWLWKKSRWWDLVASSAAEIGLVFAGLTLLTGMIWGKPTWGTYWQWDARLTTTAMLFLLLLGYQAVRQTSIDPPVRNKRAAIVGLLLLPNVLVVNRAVEWWDTLHQTTTFETFDPTIQGLQHFTWFAASILMFAVFAWMLIHRFRIGWLSDETNEQLVDLAIEERKAEAQ